MCHGDRYKYTINRWDEGWVLFNNLEGLLDFLRDLSNTMFYKEKYIDVLVFPQRLLIVFLFNRDLKEDWIMHLDQYVTEGIIPERKKDSEALIDKYRVDVSCYPKCTKERRSKCGCVEAYQYHDFNIKTFRDCPHYSLGRCTNKGWGGL